MSQLKLVRALGDHAIPPIEAVPTTLAAVFLTAFLLSCGVILCSPTIPSLPELPRPARSPAAMMFVATFIAFAIAVWAFYYIELSFYAWLDAGMAPVILLAVVLLFDRRSFDRQILLPVALGISGVALFATAFVIGKSADIWMLVMAIVAIIVTTALSGRATQLGVRVLDTAPQITEIHLVALRVVTVGATALVVALVVGAHFSELPIGWLIAGGLGLCGAMYSLFRSVRRHGGAQLVFMFLMYPVFVSLLQWSFVGDPMPLVALPGASLIVASIALRIFRAVGPTPQEA